MSSGEQPRDHPSLAKYPGHPTALYRGDDGILWRVPMQRDRDEAVPIPVEDLVQARGAVHQLKLMVERGGFDEVDRPRPGRTVCRATPSNARGDPALPRRPPRPPDRFVALLVTEQVVNPRGQ